jgi:hypothetical protein
MVQTETAAQHGPAATATLGGAEVPAVVLTGETLAWKELTYKGRTFEFSREMHIRVIEEDGGWAYESGAPRIMGFGHTRGEAESSFCFGFAFNWDQIACEDDENLTQDAVDLKRALRALVEAPKQQ